MVRLGMMLHPVQHSFKASKCFTSWWFFSSLTLYSHTISISPSSFKIRNPDTLSYLPYLQDQLLNTQEFLKESFLIPQVIHHLQSLHFPYISFPLSKYAFQLVPPKFVMLLLYPSSKLLPPCKCSLSKEHISSSSPSYQKFPYKSVGWDGALCGECCSPMDQKIHLTKLSVIC